jgi:myosin heavy subunit
MVVHNTFLLRMRQSIRNIAAVKYVFDKNCKLNKYDILLQHLKLGAINDPVVDDVRDLRRLDDALNSINISQNDRNLIYSIVAAILHLGNIDFDETPNDAQGLCVKNMQNMCCLFHIQNKQVGVQCHRIQPVTRPLHQNCLVFHRRIFALN